MRSRTSGLTPTLAARSAKRAYFHYAYCSDNVNVLMYQNGTTPSTRELLKTRFLSPFPSATPASTPCSVRATPAAHAGRCGHGASFMRESKHCMCGRTQHCTGEHCSLAHDAHGGADRSGFDYIKCPKCACVSADKARTQRTNRVIVGMNRWYESQKRNASKTDCQHVCLERAWCKCALFRTVDDGTCTLHGNLTECSREGGVSQNALHVGPSPGIGLLPLPTPTPVERQMTWHITLDVADIRRSTVFYNAIPELFSRKGRDGISQTVSGAWYDFVRAPGGELHLVSSSEAGSSFNVRSSRPHGTHSSVSVCSVAFWRGRLHDAGVTVSLAPPHLDGVALAAARVSHRLYFEDPDGHVWELVEKAKAASDMSEYSPLETCHSSSDADTTAQSTPPRTRPDPPLTSKQGIPRESLSRGDAIAGMVAGDGAVSSGNGLVTATATAVLEAGGNAAEAIIAAAAVLGVVEPFNGGLGGDAFAVIAGMYDTDLPSLRVDPNPGTLSAASYWVNALNGAGRAPVGLAPTKNALMDHLRSHDARTPHQKAASPIPKRGASSFLTLPGAPAAMCDLYLQHGGSLPWETLFGPAIDFALNGMRPRWARRPLFLFLFFLGLLRSVSQSMQWDVLILVRLPHVLIGALVLMLCPNNLLRVHRLQPNGSGVACRGPAGERGWRPRSSRTPALQHDHVWGIVARSGRTGCESKLGSEPRHAGIQRLLWVLWHEWPRE